MNNDDGEKVQTDDNMDYVEQKITRLKQALVQIALICNTTERYEIYKIADQAIRDN